MSARTKGLKLLLPVIALAVSTSAGARDPFFARWETFGREEGLPSEKVTAVVVDDAGVWAGTEAGLARLEAGRWETIGVEDGLPFPVISALAVDPANGDLWVGTLGGLARVSGGRIDVFTQLNSGLANDVVYGVAADGRAVWVATAAGLNRYDPTHDAWEIWDVSNTLMHEPWCYGVTLGEEDVYVAVWGSGVIVRERETGSFREHRDPDGEAEIDLFRDDGLVHDVTSSVAVADGVMWVGTYFGLSRYDGRRWRSYNQEDSGLASDFINYLRANGGEVWIATDRGLSRFDSDAWHTWRRSEEGGFEMEVTHTDGTVETTRASGGPASNLVLGVDVNDGDVWLATAAGLSHGIGRSAIARDPTTKRQIKEGAPR